MSDIVHDPHALRASFGRFMTGVTVVTASDENGVPVGFTANSFTSVSLNPPLLLVCPGRHLSSFDVFERAEHFAVSILAEGQEAVSNLFASSIGNRFDGCDWTLDLNGCPMITGRAAGFSCSVHNRIPSGDHSVLIGRVEAFDDQGSERPGLGYGPSGYFSLSKERLADAPTTGKQKTRASVLLDDGQNIYLTQDQNLPTVDVAGEQGALDALHAALGHMGIDARLGSVFSIYDEAGDARRIVFRGQVMTPPETLSKHPIATLKDNPVGNKVVATMLNRFASEFENQNFGLYIGSDIEGSVFPSERTQK